MYPCNTHCTCPCVYTPCTPTTLTALAPNSKHWFTTSFLPWRKVLESGARSVYLPMYTCPCTHRVPDPTTLTVLTWFCRHVSTHWVPQQRTLTARRPCLTESTRAISAHRVRPGNSNTTLTVVTLPLSELSTRRPSCSVYPLAVNPFSMISPHHVTAVRVTYSKPLSTHSLRNSSRRGHFHTSLKHQASVYDILWAKGAGK